MTHHAIIEYCLQKPGVTLRYPFDPNLPVLFVGRRMFALLGSQSGSQSVNLKAEPETAWLQRQQYPGVIVPGYHMNKRHWNTVLLNGIVAEQELLEMVDDSYQLAARGLPKTERTEIGFN